MSAVYHDYVNIGPTASVTSAAAGVTAMSAPYKGQVRRVAVLFTDANPTAGTFTFEKRTAGGGGVVAIKVVTKPAASQIGKYLYADVVVPGIINEGDEVTVTSSAIAGVVYYVVLVERNPEQLANQANAVSA